MLGNNEFRQRRLENIKRNNDLLKKLNLNGMSSQLKREAGVGEKPKLKAVPPPKKKVSKGTLKSEAKTAVIPTRRSRRLRGESAEADGIPNVNDSELMKVVGNSDAGRELDGLQELKNTQLVGDIKLGDLLKDEDKSELLAKFKVYSDGSFSSGDFFEELKKHQRPTTEIKQLQTEFQLSQYEIYDPKELAIGYERITAMYFHPSQEKKLIVGGDTGGTVGLWNVADEMPDLNDELAEPEITRFKMFSRNVAKIDTFPADSSKLLTASYDGSLRSIHLDNLNSEELAVLKNDYGEPLGISDCQFSYSDPNLLLITTLGGEFTQFDLRAKPNAINFLRLSDKKIGSMAINPKRVYEIATGSLDRTLKIWDMRKIVVNPDWSQYEEFSSHEVVSTYESRLSISAISFSPIDGTLVCNGYDNTIRLFDVNDNIRGHISPKLTIQHNCKTGRWVSILKAKFKPNMDVFAIANMKRAIDIYSSSGEQLAHLPTSTVPAVLSWHPLQNWIVGGNSSGKVFLFTNEQRD
ncbi:Cmr1p Ecym_4649 [Eremothecium cymbalariae DBVPG|uniref:DNA damage-binding protein CMR1 n=1 Tax=Eremothecium cymbalariae (strain CBS 270.75 / DBVPG 7215 / KCTC 17166 / NRRL Y-17582) TaxID=931890 RepID=G8JSF0_ERECY|nr:hypothetical protein Ecym_4649 [Eremothecium cymbalariae DBVPG\